MGRGLENKVIQEFDRSNVGGNFYFSLKKTTRPNVLIAEDDDFDFKHLEETFEKIEFHPNITRAEDGLQLLNIIAQYDLNKKEIEENPFVAIVLDLKMPNFTGLEALNTLRKHKNLHIQDIPVIVLTTSMFEEDVMEARDLGVIDFILKPDTQRETTQICNEIKRVILGLSASHD